MTAGMPVAHADAMRVGVRGTTRRVWGRGGVKIVQPVQMSDAWQDPFVAVDGRAGTPDWCWRPTVGGDDTVTAVGERRRHTPIQTLIWDGAPSHHDARLPTIDLPLVYLSPYSPELNPAERILHELRRAVAGRVCATLDDKVAAVEAERIALAADPDRVRSLATWHGIATALDGLPPAPDHSHLEHGLISAD